jgi:hypothetical protein
MGGPVGQADKRPVVQPVALGAAAGRHALPGPRRDPPEGGHRRSSCRRRHAPGGRKATAST